MEQEVNTGNVFFNIDSRLLFQLGENLVTNRAVALAELIKNSYDADATNVVVRMDNIKSPGGKIVIEDNGTGMPLDSFKKTWMRIATIDKEDNPISKKYKRKKAGEKGIGRFACRRLSKTIIIKSISKTKDGNKEELDATFDWNEFKPGSDVDKIPVKYDVKSIDKVAKTGTTLILENTNESWTSWDIRHLRSEIAELISPITFEAESEIVKSSDKYDPGFHIEFVCPEFPTKEEALDKTFFKNAWAKLIGCVDENGFASYEITVINKLMNKIEKKFLREEPYANQKNTKMEIYIFSYIPELFRDSEWVYTKAIEVGRESGGVKVYADKFRVFGYGSKGDDWLRLDYDRSRSVTVLDEKVNIFIEEDKRPGLRLFMNRSLFGHVVFIKDNNPNLKITINRERLIENESFNELKSFVRLGIDFATVVYSNEVFKKVKEKRLKKEAEEETRRQAEREAIKKAEELLRNAEEKRRKAEELAREAEEKRRKAEEERRKIEEDARGSPEGILWKNVEQAIKKEKEQLRIEEEERIKAEQLSKIADIERQKVNELFRKAEEKRIILKEEELRNREAELKEKQEKIEDEHRLLRVLASTGTLILIYSHELQALIENIEEMNNSFKSIVGKLSPNEQKHYNVIQDSFTNRIDMIKKLGNFLGLMINRDSRSIKKEWVLFPLIEGVFKPLKSYLKEFGIEYSNSISNNLRSPEMFQSDLLSIFHNLISNAIKAVKGEKSVGGRQIWVTGFEKDGMVYIRFLDTGKGLDVSRREIVFEPFESDSEPDLRFGAGTGLGLKIVRDIIRYYGGEIRFINAPEDWKTCIEITLPRR